jgi:hypothetical protein
MNKPIVRLSFDSNPPKKGKARIATPKIWIAIPMYFKKYFIGYHS